MKVIHSQDELPHGYSRPVATIGNFDGLHLGHRQLLLGVVEHPVEIGIHPQERRKRCWLHFRGSRGDHGPRAGRPAHLGAVAGEVTLRAVGLGEHVGE